MTGFPPSEDDFGTIFGALYWVSSAAKTPIPHVMEPLDMPSNPPSIIQPVFSHESCLHGRKTPKNEQKSNKIVDKILRVVDKKPFLATLKWKESPYFLHNLTYISLKAGVKICRLYFCSKVCKKCNNLLRTRLQKRFWFFYIAWKKVINWTQNPFKSSCNTFFHCHTLYPKYHGHTNQNRMFLR